MNLELIFKEFPVFHKWTLEKKLNETDLSILTEFSQSEPIKQLILWIENHFVSHAHGVQILDLAGELLLANKKINHVLQNHTDSSSLLKELRKHRFPESSLREEKKQQFLNQLNLGKSIKAKWVREKDRTGVQLEFKSFSPKDLKQKIERLKSLFNEESLWKD